MRRLVVLLLGIALVAGCAGSDGDDDPGAGPPRITVHGSGSVRVEPDLLTVMLGVQTQAPKAVDALRDNSRRASGVLDELRRRGVGEDDLQTSQVSVSPNYDQRGRIIGFIVDNAVTARLHDLDRAGELLDAVAAAAGDAIRVQGFQFSVEDPASAAADARADAVRRARRQAEQLARAAGVRLGKLRSLREMPTSQPQPAFTADSALASGGSTGAVPLAAGSLEVRIDVDLVYDVLS